MFFIDFHAPCGVLGVEHPDTFSPELLPAKQPLDTLNIDTQTTPSQPKIENSQLLLGTESLSTAVTPDWPKPRIENSVPLLGPASYSPLVGPDFPKPPQMQSVVIATQMIQPDLPPLPTK